MSRIDTIICEECRDRASVCAHVTESIGRLQARAERAEAEVERLRAVAEAARAIHIECGMVGNPSIGTYDALTEALAALPTDAQGKGER